MQNKKQERSSYSIHGPLEEYAAHSGFPCSKMQASRARTRTRPAGFHPPLYGPELEPYTYTQCSEIIPVRTRMHTVGMIGRRVQACWRG